MIRSWTRWYIEKLKTHPMSVNIGSALVLMVLGDVAAQEIEIHYHGAERVDDVVNNNNNNNGSSRKLSFRRYGTLSPDVASVQEERILADEQETLRRRASTITRRMSYRTTARRTLQQYMDELDELKEESKHLFRTIHSELASLDLFRMATMSFWAAFLSTPIFILLYRMYDRILPRGTTPMTVTARCALSFAASIPVNALFFCYGTLIHHVTEWYALVSEWQYKVPDATLRQILVDVPLDIDMLLSSTRLKLETELMRTVLASASIWIPINLLNFSLVAPHLRPLTLTVCSAFWNCYLSLAQHREAVI